MTMPKPMVRSMRPAIIGKVAASDSSAMMALSARIERKFRYVGKVFGKSSEKKMIKRTVRIGRP